MIERSPALELDGFEHDWLATDLDGSVALLSTAGGGRVPAIVVASIDEYDDAIDLVLAMPVLGAALAAPTVGPGCVNTWALVAERGLYAYDAAFPGPAAYGRVAIPSRSVRLFDLPPSIQPLVARHRFETRFADAARLDPEE